MVNILEEALGIGCRDIKDVPIFLIELTKDPPRYELYKWIESLLRRRYDFAIDMWMILLRSRIGLLLCTGNRNCFFATMPYISCYNYKNRFIFRVDAYTDMIGHYHFYLDFGIDQLIAEQEAMNH